MMKSRYEMKYLVTEAQALMMAEYIRPYMRPDRHSSQGQYALASLYLDSRDLRLCRESLDGVKNRFKLRIRCYSDDPDALCFFEIKRRMNQVIIKSRARVPRFAVPALLHDEIRPTEVSCDEHESLEQFLYYRRQIDARPLVRIRYYRQAFESRYDDPIRITFDRALCFSATRVSKPSMNGPGWVQWRDRAVVLEIKFADLYPEWIHRLVQDFSLAPQSVSKYARMVTQACAMRFCAPVQQSSTILDTAADFIPRRSEQVKPHGPRDGDGRDLPSRRAETMINTWV